ncbi:hypothetical protein AXW67_37715 [Bradyrhizobium neotropicale]|uniref:Uncharacterized protein n=1 Tax=Bradyrhizobium neotropicale TaxID=1497615 RepID=A0A176ZH44_9BRAD|nr:hypothetical protein [Bradyrhizobium neotropicale]OAF19203.1 hypothetical protein AXW67_37715 [Bradyrhizobium neotropicale]
MNFQVTVLKILVSYPGGFAPMAELKRDMAILATSGRDWAERTKRMATRAPDLDIFSQRLIERVNGGWRITEKGRAVLDVMEARSIPTEMQPEMIAPASELAKPTPADTLPVRVAPGPSERRRRRRVSGSGSRANWA